MNITPNVNNPKKSVILPQTPFSKLNYCSDSKWMTHICNIQHSHIYILYCMNLPCYYALFANKLHE